MSVTSQTLAGMLQSTIKVDLGGMILPEFFKTWSLDKLTARLFQADCHYDAIIGCDVLNQLGIMLNFKDKVMFWDDAKDAECHL